MPKSQSSKIAEKNHHPKDYESKNEFDVSLAMTHEQVSDTFTEGTIEANMDNVNGQDVTIPRKGYES